MIDPANLRSLGLELMPRSRDNAFRSHREYRDADDATRAKAYDELKAQIQQEGFQQDCPIQIMLNRENGSKDKILQGHHRLSIAIELGLSEVPVRFVVGNALQEDDGPDC